jgi:glucosamine-6-phosphate deaminase
MTSSVEWTSFATDTQLGAAAAQLITDRIVKAHSGGDRFVLGCPAGRSAQSTYRALAQRVASDRIDLSNLHLILMDEFVEREESQWRLCDADAHYSCRKFAEFEIRRLLNGTVSEESGIPASNLHVPDPSRPQDFETLIQHLGGIDLFLLASGASDGHVAFNPPDTSITSRTRVIRLAESTRADNMATFPAFQNIAAVPQFGVSVGLGTIVDGSHAALLLLSGAHKRKAAARLRALERFDASWPASVIFACADARIFIDSAAQPERGD